MMIPRSKLKTLSILVLSSFLLLEVSHAVEVDIIAPEDFQEKYNNKKVVHLKGFITNAKVPANEGVRYDDPETAAYGKLLVKDVLASKPDVLVWDGDEYLRNSFTHLIPENFTGLELVMFKQRYEGMTDGDLKKKVEKQWERFSDMKITVVTAPNFERDFAGLGKFSLATTGTKDVFCFGGGLTVSMIIHQYQKEGVKFHVYPISRIKFGKKVSSPILQGAYKNADIRYLEKPQVDTTTKETTTTVVKSKATSGEGEQADATATGKTSAASRKFVGVLGSLIVACVVVFGF